MLLKLDMASKVPIYMQIRNQIVLGIASGELAPGEKLPTIRALAEQSGVNMMTVNKAYGLLKQEGYITTDRRGGTVVSGSPGAGALSERYVAALRVIAAEARLTKQKVLKELKQQMEGLIQQIEDERLWISDLKELHNQVAEAVAQVTAADEKIKTEELFKALQ